MKRAVVISELKPVNGPIAESIKKTGITVLDFSMKDEISKQDQIIIFYNKVPPKLETKAKVAWWMNDLNKPDALQKKEDYAFDLIFLCHKTFDKEYSEAYNKPIFYMPQCGAVVDWEEERSITWESVFIGNINNNIYRKQRPKDLDYISRLTNLKIISGEKTTKDQAFIYRHSTFSFAMSYPMIEGTSNRLYNILASGGLAVVKYYPGMEKQFENHRHLIWYKENEELVELLNFYRQNSFLIPLIKQCGYRLYKEKHTAEHRLNNMFDIMEGKTKDFYGYL